MFCRCFGRPLSLHVARVAARYLPDRFDPTWEKKSRASQLTMAVLETKKGAYLCAPMSSSFQAFVTHNFVTHTLFSHTTFTRTIFHRQLCHNLSFTHNFVTHHLSLSHNIFHIQLCHTQLFAYNLFYFSFLHHLLCLSFLPRPATTFVAH